MRKAYKHLLSGEQIVTADGSRDRVHGVTNSVGGTVTVSTDSCSTGREYPADTTVEVY